MILLPLKYLKSLKQLLTLKLKEKFKKLQSKNKQEKEPQDVKESLSKTKINNELYVDVDFDEHTQMVYLMLNRASFAISLDEFAEFTISLNSAFESLVNHPNILFTLERNDETGDERRAFVYVDSQEDEFVN